MDFANKRILITHTMIYQIMGSTVVVSQIASVLQQRGAHVTVFSASFDGPAKELFVRKGIEVMTDEDEPLDLYSFDFIWVDSQILPLSIVRGLDDYNAASSERQASLIEHMPCFIFNHMGALEEVSDEYPYIPLLEETLASLEVYVSQEAADVMRPYYDQDLNRGIPRMLFPNPAPSDFVFERGSCAGKALSSVLIVSNHVPSEVLEAQSLLEQQGIVVRHIGKGGEECEVIPSLLGQTDAVVTIGKTVQYCLVSGTPVFVYDHLGGFGYLNEANFDAAKYANFSGRGGTNMDAHEIAEALVRDYAGALEFFKSRVDEWREEFSFDAQLRKVFEAAHPREAIAFPYRGYTRTLMQQMRFAIRSWRNWTYLLESVDHIQDQNEGIADLVQGMDDIKGSASFKAGRALTAPARLLRDALKKDQDSNTRFA